MKKTFEDSADSITDVTPFSGKPNSTKNSILDNLDANIFAAAVSGQIDFLKNLELPKPLSPHNIFIAAQNGSIEVLKKFSVQKKDINFVMKFMFEVPICYTPLDIALKNNHSNVVEYLKQCGGLTHAELLSQQEAQVDVAGQNNLND